MVLYAGIMAQSSVQARVFGRGCVLESVGVWVDIYGGTLLGVGWVDGGVWESLSVLKCYGCKVLNCRLLIIMLRSWTEHRV